jgi:hypothetical protein
MFRFGVKLGPLAFCSFWWFSAFQRTAGSSPISSSNPIARQSGSSIWKLVTNRFGALD